MEDVVPEDLKASARAGVRWSGLLAAASGVVQVLRLFVLARYLLEPDDFGLMALAVSCTYIASPLADAGTQLALIHKQDATRQEISSLYWFNVGLGLLLSLLLWIVAPYLGGILGDARVGPVLRMASLCFAVEGFGLTFLILMKRDLDFRRTSLIEAGALIGGTVVTFVLAFLHWGVWSLAVGLVSTSLLRAVMSIACGIRRHSMDFRLRFDELGDFLRFGVFQMAQTAVVRMSERFDQIIVGLLGGAASVGLYSVAYNIASIPVLHVLPLLAMPAASVFSRAEARKDGAQLARGYFLAVEMMMTLNGAIAFGLLAVAPTFVPALLGEKWVPIVPILQALCVVTIWYAFYSLSGALVIAKGQTRLGFLWRLGLTAALICAGYVGARLGGASGLATALALVLAAGAIPFYFVVVRRLIGPSAARFATALCVPLALAATMAVVVLLVGSLLASAPPLLRLALQIGLGAAIFGVLVVAVRPSIASEMALVAPHEAIRSRLTDLLARADKVRQRLMPRLAGLF
ncbi:MAG: MOP flippase family protein [Hyphomicrobiaceae bacterium]